MNTQIIKVSDLVEHPLRDIRQCVLDKLRERIGGEGGRYNPARALSVIQIEGRYQVIDGNHRLTILRELKIKEVPCVVYEATTDIYELSIKCNEDEETYAPLDLFDWLDIIGRMRTENITQEQIGKRIGWSREKVRNYTFLIDKIGTQNINIAKSHQCGRVPDNGTIVPIDFTEGGLRDLIGLNEDNQKYVIDEIIKTEGELKGGKLKQLCDKLKLHEDMIKYIDTNLQNKEAYNGLVNDINNSIYSKIEQIHKKVDELNKEAQKLLIHGDAIKELAKIQDDYIDVVITDPPYGMNYVSNRREHDYDEINEAISNDDKKSALKLLDNSMAILKTKTKPNAFVYVFCTWKTYPEFKEIISKYFNVSMVLFWDKKNHGTGNLEIWRERVEMIIFATKGDKKLSGDIPSNLLSFGRVDNKQRQHPTEKPVDLLEFLITKSAGEGDVICDPFMGVGSTIVATKGKYPYIGIELDEKYFKIAKRRINEQ